MDVHWDRFRVLLRKRSIGGWILWALALGWKRLGDWQNAAWLQHHLFPKAWPKTMPHLDYITLFLILAGLAWFTVILLWPNRETKKDGKSWLGEPQNAPHIDLIYNLPRLSDAGIHHQIRDEQISLVNTTDRIAYDVEISPIRTSAYVATFDPVPRLSKNEPVNVRVDIRTTPQGSYYSGFEAVCKWEYENSTHSDTTEVRIPLTVRYYDQNKDKQFETLHEIVYESFLCEARSRLVRGVQIVPKT